MDEAEHQDYVDGKRRARMAQIDALPEAVRELVHDYGFNIVDSFMRCGVTKPKQIKHLVETVLNDMVSTRGAFSAQGIRNPLKQPKGTT